MDHQRTALRFGAGVLALAVVVRLMSGSLPMQVLQTLEQPGVQSFLIYLQTGRVIRRPQIPLQPEPTQPTVQATQPTLPSMEPTQPETVLPVFAEEDLQHVSVSYGCDYRPELQELLQSPLQWDLTGEAPAVLIVHTHATESYEKDGEAYEEDAPYRTLDDRYNMVSIGDEVARRLEEGGISVLHDRSYHDYPSYNGSYGSARVSIEAYLQEYPSIAVVLDIHRDASDGSDGSQLVTEGWVDGQSAAQLMMVVGTDASGNYHPNWKDNLSLALKLSALLEREHPGLTRPVNLRAERFNMDMTPGSLIVEVGGAGNTHKQAMLAAAALADAVLALSKGSSTS